MLWLELDKTQKNEYIIQLSIYHTHELSHKYDIIPSFRSVIVNCLFAFYMLSLSILSTVGCAVQFVPCPYVRIWM